MTILVISGVDGSGKTSVIEALQKVLEDNGYGTRYTWLRYNHFFSKFILAFCRYTGLTRYLHFESSRVVYHDFHRSRIISALYITTTYIDTFFVSLFKVYLPHMWSDKVVICDRWVYDIMVDLEVDTRYIFNDNSFLKPLFLSMLPSDARCYLISRDSKLVRGERDESLNDENFPIRCRHYERHSSDSRLYVINNNGTINESVNQILTDSGFKGLVVKA